jgi:hypothetical protein
MTKYVQKIISYKKHSNHFRVGLTQIDLNGFLTFPPPRENGASNHTEKIRNFYLHPL